jgi:hypothetical protein
LNDIGVIQNERIFSHTKKSILFTTSGPSTMSNNNNTSSTSININSIRTARKNRPPTEDMINLSPNDNGQILMTSSTGSIPNEDSYGSKAAKDRKDVSPTPRTLNKVCHTHTRENHTCWS